MTGPVLLRWVGNCCVTQLIHSCGVLYNSLMLQGTTIDHDTRGYKAFRDFVKQRNTSCVCCSVV